MQTSWQKIVDITQAFADEHLQVKRFKSDFFEQLDSFVNEGEECKIMYLVPPSGLISENTDTYTAELYVLDQIQEGRENITTIVSDAHLILTDFFKYIRLSYDLEIDISGDGSRESINNSLLDNYAGAKATLTFEVDSIGVCQLPLESNL